MAKRAIDWACAMYRDHIWVRRLWWGSLTLLILTGIVVGLLSFADTYAINEGKRCAPSIAKSQWPMYLGCAMATHEDLAAGLIGGAGALFAAWLAFTAVQEQIGEERSHRERQTRNEEERRRRQQTEAKQAAIGSIAQTVHAAAATLFVVERAIRAGYGMEQGNADQLVEQGVRHIQRTLESFTVREIFRDLGADDRLIYLAIIGTLETLVSVSLEPSPVLNRMQRLENQRHALMNVHHYLGAFDSELASIYARDSGTTSPTA
jgi:hypothetical protein